MSTKLYRTLPLLLLLGLASIASAQSSFSVDSAISGQYNLNCSSDPNAVVDSTYTRGSAIEQTEETEEETKSPVTTLSSDTINLRKEAAKAGLSAAEAMQSVASQGTTSFGDKCKELKELLGSLGECKIYVQRTKSTQHTSGSTVLYYLAIGDQYCGINRGSGAGQIAGDDDYQHYDGWYNVDHAKEVMNGLLDAAIATTKRQQAEQLATQVQCASCVQHWFQNGKYSTEVGKPDGVHKSLHQDHKKYCDEKIASGELKCCDELASMLPPQSEFYYETNDQKAQIEMQIADKLGTLLNEAYTKQCTDNPRQPTQLSCEVCNTDNSNNTDLQAACNTYKQNHLGCPANGDDKALCAACFEQIKEATGVNHLSDIKYDSDFAQLFAKIENSSTFSNKPGTYDLCSGAIIKSETNSAPKCCDIFFADQSIAGRFEALKEKTAGPDKEAECKFFRELIQNAEQYLCDSENANYKSVANQLNDTICPTFVPNCDICIEIITAAATNPGQNEVSMEVQDINGGTITITTPINEATLNSCGQHVQKENFQCCNTYTASENAKASQTQIGNSAGAIDESTGESYPSLIDEQNSYNSWTKWYESNATQADLAKADNFCSYQYDLQNTSLFCGDPAADHVKQTSEEFCSNCARAKAGVEEAKKAGPEACQAELAKIQSDAGLTAKCDFSELACENKPIGDPSAKGPCESIINLNDKIVGPTGKLIGNPFLLSENDDFIAGSSTELEKKKEYIMEGKQAFSGAIYEKEDTFFTECQKMASVEWGDMVANREGEGTLDQMWSLSWAVFTQKLLEDYAKLYRGCKEIEDRLRNPMDPNTTPRPNPTLEEIIEAADQTIENQKLVAALEGQTGANEMVAKSKTKAKEHLIKIRTCTALVQMTYETDYEDPEVNTGAKKVSADSAITCTRKGALTQDFKGCSGLVDVYNASLLAEQALIAGQQIDFKGKQVDWQRELAADEDNIKGPIRMQIKTLKQQKSYAEVQAGAHGVKAGGLEVAISEIPEMETLLKQCSTNYYPEAGHQDYAFIIGKIFNDTPEEDQAPIYNNNQLNNAAIKGRYDSSYYADKADGETQPICASTIKEHRGLKLIVNSPGRSQGHAAALQATIKAAEQIMVANVIGKQITTLEGMLNDIDNFKPADLAYSIEDLVAQECEINPTATACTGTLDSSTEVGFVGQSFSVGGTGRSGTGDYTLPDQDGTVATTDNQAGQLGADNKFAPIDTGNKANRGLTNTVGRGSVKSSVGSGGGGGGGGGARSVSAPSGGGKRSSASAPRSRYQAKDYKYSGTSKGIGYGSASRSKRKSSKGNPFAKLFNKSAAGKKEVVNFRDLASKGEIGTKSGRDIFKMISDRYDSVENNKQLLEYQKTK